MKELDMMSSKSDWNIERERHGVETGGQGSKG